MNAKFAGFVALILFWMLVTFLCFFHILVFDSSSLGGAMLSSFVLTSSVLGMVQLLKTIYDKAYKILLANED
jgi:hypothetical protein